MKRIIILLSVVLAVSGCYLADTLNFINTPAEISLTWRGEPQVTYESQSYQMGFNDHKNEYRIYEDRLANWFTIRCSDRDRLLWTFYQSATAFHRMHSVICIRLPGRTAWS